MVLRPGLGTVCKLAPCCHSQAVDRERRAVATWSSDPLHQGTLAHEVCKHSACCTMSGSGDASVRSTLDLPVGAPASRAQATITRTYGCWAADFCSGCRGGGSRNMAQREVVVARSPSLHAAAPRSASAAAARESQHRRRARVRVCAVQCWERTRSASQ